MEIIYACSILFHALLCKASALHNTRHGVQGKERQVIEAIRIALRTRTVSYEISRRDYHVDENTGQLVKRSTISS